MPKSDNQHTGKAQTFMLAFLCIKGVEGLAEQVTILDRFGLTDADIATVCNAAIQSVRNARLAAKRGPRR